MVKKLIYILLSFCVVSFGQFGHGMSFYQQTTQISNDSLVAYYPFNGNTNDESGSGYNLTNNGVTFSTDRNNVASSAALFAVIENDYLTLSDQTNIRYSSTNELSISFWFLYSSLGTMVILNKGWGSDVNKREYIVFTNSNQLYFGANNGSYIILSGLIVSKWYHGVIILRSNLSIDIVINNGSPNTGIAGSFRSSPNGTFEFGRNQGANYYNGKIDDVRMYNRILTPSEITLLYNE